MRGNVVLITGATSGLGKEAAAAVAPMRPRLYLVGRDRARTEATAAAIAHASGNDDVHVLIGDLATQAGVRAVAAAFLATGDPLHVLLNNAGAVQGFRRQVSVEGVELTIALNHLAYFLLTVLLLERLRESAPARIVNVASDAYKSPNERFDFDEYNAERRYRPIRQYGRSKLANILFTRELARRLAGSGVTVNAATPPRLTATRFAHNVHPLAKVALRLASPFTMSPAKGAESVIHLCSSPEVAGMTGTYWSGMNQPPLTAAATNDADARRLWDLSTRLTGVDSD
jgi:retinol dehydrogenase 12